MTAVAEFLDEAEKANNEVEAVHFDMDLSLQVNTNKKTQEMRADIDYGKQGDTIQRANARIDEVITVSLFIKNIFCQEAMEIQYILEPARMVLGINNQVMVAISSSQVTLVF